MSRTFRFAACAALVLTAAPMLAQTGPLRFFPTTPCRLADTRQPSPGNPMTGLETRDFDVQGVCGIPTNAKAVVLNATIINPTTNGYITLFPSGVTRPVASNLNFRAAEPALANGSIVGLSTNDKDLSVYFFQGSVSATGHLVLDTTGYFCKVDAGGACIP